MSNNETGFKTRYYANGATNGQMLDADWGGGDTWQDAGLQINVTVVGQKEISAGEWSQVVRSEVAEK